MFRKPLVCFRAFGVASAATNMDCKCDIVDDNLMNELLRALFAKLPLPTSADPS
jgi:hypothetical protein